MVFFINNFLIRGFGFISNKYLLFVIINYIKALYIYTNTHTHIITQSKSDVILQKYRLNEFFKLKGLKTPKFIIKFCVIRFT